METPEQEETMLYGDKHMDHAAYQQKVRTMSAQTLQFTIQDAQEAMAANPQNPNNGYYADEVCYCAQELQRRRTAGLDHYHLWQDAAMDVLDDLVVDLTPPTAPMPQSRRRILSALRHPAAHAAIKLAASPMRLEKE